LPANSICHLQHSVPEQITPIRSVDKHTNKAGERLYLDYSRSSIHLRDSIISR
jgi:hypothetical protein